MPSWREASQRTIPRRQACATTLLTEESMEIKNCGISFAIVFFFGTSCCGNALTTTSVERTDFTEADAVVFEHGYAEIANDSVAETNSSAVAALESTFYDSMHPSHQATELMFARPTLQTAIEDIATSKGENDVQGSNRVVNVPWWCTIAFFAALGFGGLRALNIDTPDVE